MHHRYHSTKLQVFQEYLAPRRVLVLIREPTALPAHVKSLSRHKTPLKDNKKGSMSHVYGNFIEDEYTHILRLESELSDLRVGYANPIPSANAWSAPDNARGQK